MSAWHEIGGGYAYALCRVGMTLRAPNGATVYVQPGDDTAAMLETIDAFDEITEVPECDLITNPRMTEDESAAAVERLRARIVDMTLGEYFQ